MILKTFELQKINKINAKYFLFYGQNEGLKRKAIKENFSENFSGEIQRFDENEILNNLNYFISNLMNKSFFEEKKLILISRVSEKSLKIIEEILEKNIKDIIIVLNSGNLDKKSKLRNFFEKNKEIICTPFYSDEARTLSLLAINFFKLKKIPISQENINLIVDRCNGDRQNLDNELEKISIYCEGKKTINAEEILKLTNLAENFSIYELTDNCLSKNLDKTIKILNENNYSTDDCMLIIRTLLSKAKRVLKLKKDFEKNRNLDETISLHKPPIFWKDKEIIKKQILNWSLKDAEKLIYRINDIELLIKENSLNSIRIMSDFMLSMAAEDHIFNN